MNQNFKEGHEIFFIIKPDDLVLKEKKIRFREYFKLKVNLKLRESELSKKKDTIFITMEKGKATFQHPCLYFSHTIQTKKLCSYNLTLLQMNEKKKFVEKKSIQIPCRQCLKKISMGKNFWQEIRYANAQFILFYKMYICSSQQELQKLLSAPKCEQEKKQNSKKFYRNIENIQDKDKSSKPSYLKNKKICEQILSCEDSDYEAYRKQLIMQNKKNPKVIIFRRTDSILCDIKQRNYDHNKNFIKQANPLFDSTLNSTLASQITQSLIKRVFSPEKDLHLPISSTLLHQYEDCF